MTYALSSAQYHEVAQVLYQAGRSDLVKSFKQTADVPSNDSLTSKAAASMLGVSSANTVKNWLEGGYFPGAYKTPGGHWRFPRAEVEAVRARLQELRDRNLRGDLEPTEVDDDCSPPLL